MTKKLVCLLLLACVALVHIENAFACHSKSFGGDTQVCVCSATQSCDGELEHTNSFSAVKGTATSFVTAKTGARMEKAEHQFAAAAPTTAFNFEVDIDHTQRHQKIIGFGGAFTDSAGWNIGRMARDLQGRLINDYFGPDGIEYRLGRATIGGSDFSTRAYSYDDNPKDESLSTFALQNEDYNYKMPFMRWAKEVTKHPTELKFFGSAWSAPAWMKTNHELNHGGFLRDAPGGHYYKAFAKYTVKFVQEYAKNNVSIWGLTIVNEPGFGNDKGFRYNCLGFTAQTQRDYIKMDLGPELHAANLANVAVMHFDHNIDHLEEYANTILGDKDAAQYVAGTAYHWYERTNTKFNYSLLNQISQRYPDKFLLNTEACLGYGPPKSLGDWHNFNEYATDIVDVLNQGVAGWVDWNMVLDMKGGPSWAGTVVDAPVHVSDDGKEYYKLPLYYAMGHFSKFLVPDSVRINAAVKHDTNGNNVLVTVFERPDKAVVVTLLNKNAHKISVKVHDPNQGYLSVDVGADSMETIIWH